MLRNERLVRVLTSNHALQPDKTPLSLGIRIMFHVCPETPRSRLAFILVALLAASGCQKISYGVESGSPRILELLNKKITVEEARRAFAWSKQAGIRFVEGSFMIGAHPTETEADIKMSEQLIFDIEPDILMLAIMVPYPGTESYRLMQQRGYFASEIRWDDFAFFSYRPAWRTDNFSAEELVETHRKMLRKFYLRPKYIFKILSKVRSWHEFLYWVSEAANFTVKTKKVNSNEKS